MVLCVQKCQLKCIAMDYGKITEVAQIFRGSDKKKEIGRRNSRMNHISPMPIDLFLNLRIGFSI